MKKLDELVTSTEKSEQKAKRKAITFGSFKRAEEKQIAERKEREHQRELARIAEEAKIARQLVEEEQRVINEENKRKRNEFITESMSNAFNTKTDIDYKNVREKVIEQYLPQLREQEVLDDYPKPFEAEPALNRELAEFKNKINEHLHKVGFMGSGGGGIGDIKDAGDEDGSAQIDGKFLKFRASDGKFIGDDIAIADGGLSLTKLDIDGGTDIGAAIVDADLFIIDDGAGGTNRKVAASRIKTYAAYDGSISTLDIDGGTDIGEAIVDADLFIIDNGAGGTNRKTEASRIKTYIADVTLTTAAQTNITSLGTLTTLTVDNIIINGTNIGHTSDTDAISIDSSGNVTASQNLTVTGDFTVNGTTTTVSTTNLKVSDTLIELNTGAGSNSNDMGIIMERGSTGDNAIFMFDESEDEFTVGTTTATNDATGNISITAGTFTAATLKGNVVVADDGNIGSASDTDAIAIASNGIVNFTAGATIASNTIKTAGKETIFIPAAAMYATTTNGCSALAQVEISSGQPELKVLDFDPSSDENAQFSIAFPKSWNEGVITFRAFFTVTGTNTGTVSWALSGVSMGDNDTIGANFGTAVAPTAKAHSGTSNDINITAESGNVTISNAAVDEYVFFNIMRDVSADNQTGDARLIGIQIFFTTDAANDA